MTLYQKIYEELSEQIRSGFYGIGDALPTEMELVARYGVSRITVKKSLDMLVKEGIVERIAGRGSFVRARPEDKKPPEASRVRHIGLILPNLLNDFNVLLFAGMEKTCNRHTVLSCRISDGNYLNEGKLIQEFRQNGFDGLIISPSYHKAYSNELLSLVLDNYPVVLLDTTVKAVSVSSVCTDHRRAARKGMEYLIAQGHRDIGIICANRDQLSAPSERSLGVMDACMGSDASMGGVAWLDTVNSLDGMQGGYEQDVEKIAAFVRANPRMTVLYCFGYNLALLAKAALERLGMRIPQDMSMLCFDRPIQCHPGKRQFTHICQRADALCATAMELVLRMCEGDRELHRVLVDADLVDCGTVRRLDAQ
ncbi:GntR family transcriptional regulator [Beduinella massiliensis]|uniref:GntR family transcriptional regulator n=1 Tax=Beduinella massiliensis TaxID=1852363 RepID=UPI0031F96452